ncbi:MAG TPA: MauE/DoxX family redox-associated membrane protein [Actinophytocola sp.]|jgi:uncharacterized membrane protein|uniref:MauE/DoxX family redox-associated membrane protein n=1 Tax=Actinophytocola sp. TaxID=1872138 RepID=UPI002E0785C8|nr:MauE/DoxX family redox-associated membrane protein [Actinophytocola sp.]
MSVVAGIPGGAALLLAGLLILAGGLKVLRPKPFVHAVYRLLPRHVPRRETLARFAPWVVGTVELLAGPGLLVAASRPAAWWSAAVIAGVAVLYLAFVVVVRYAALKGASCGCFASFSDGVAGGAELARTLTLAALAVSLLITALLTGAASWWRLDALAWLVAFGVLVVIATALGGRRRPAGWLLLGRVRSRLAAVELPTMVTGAERTAAIAAARTAPSVRAFQDWLGDRAAGVDWRRCEVRTTSATPRAGRRVPCLLVSPRCRAGLTMTVSLPDGFPERAVVIAAVDGQPVTALGETVKPGPRPALQRA